MAFDTSAWSFYILPASLAAGVWNTPKGDLQTSYAVVPFNIAYIPVAAVSAYIAVNKHQHALDYRRAVSSAGVDADLW